MYEKKAIFIKLTERRVCFVRRITQKCNMDDNKYWIWFSRIEKLSVIKKGLLLNKFKNPQNIWNLKKQELSDISELDENNVNEILEKKYRENLDKYQSYIEKNKIQMITLYDSNYPEQLKQIYDKPIVLYAIGNIDLLHKSGVAIVGCRECSEYGKKTAQKMGYELAKRDICIISGLAKGIDKYSHIGALEAEGSTIAIIGNGLDYIYPYENKNLYERIIRNNGLIVTEYIVGTKPNKLNFPARNRIISGLSTGVVVIEAKEKSCSLITADFALEQGKDVFAVPGNIDNPNSKGTNELIKQGAIIVTDYRDVMEVL